MIYLMKVHFMSINDLNALIWDSSLETGYGKVDNQHKQLFAAVNNLIEASASGKGDKVVMDVLEFLTSYVIKHFTDEEQLQIDYDYPDYLNHKRIHDDFKAASTELVQQVSLAGPTGELIEKVVSVTGAWLVNHIRGDDFRMAAFVKAADAKATAEAQALAEAEG